MGIQERKGREKEARREEIISAAERVFIEKGLNASTMDEVAEAAELSKGTLYLYYRSKEDLYLAFALRGMEIMHKLFQDAVSTEEDSIKCIVNLEEAYYTFFRDYRHYFRALYFFESPEFQTQVSEPMRVQCFVMDRKVWDFVTQVMRRGIEEGFLHDDLDPFEAGIMLWSNANGLLRLIDRHESYWKEVMNIDLEKTLRKSNALLIEAMMTERAQALFPEMVPRTRQFRNNTNDSQNT
jgi:TetR/AcrR family transcriptional regulator